MNYYRRDHSYFINFLKNAYTSSDINSIFQQRVYSLKLNFVH